MAPDDTRTVDSDLSSVANADMTSRQWPVALVDQTLGEFACAFAHSPAAWRSISWRRRLSPTHTHDRYPDERFVYITSVIHFELTLLALCDDAELARLSRASLEERTQVVQFALATLMRQSVEFATRLTSRANPDGHSAEPQAS